MKNSPVILCDGILLFKNKEKKWNNSIFNSLYQRKLFIARFIQIFIIAAILFYAKAAKAQLGSYAFSGTAACPNLSNAVGTQPANAVFSPFYATGLNCISSDTSYLNSGWTTSAIIDSNQYNEFTIAPDAGFLLTLSSLSFDHQVSTDNTPSVTWILRSSLDNYSTDISSGIATTSLQNVVVTMPPADFTNIGAVTFRLYIINSSGTNETWSNDNVSLDGIVSRIPTIPADPGSNSPQCANTGITLTRTGIPAADETWYWQTNATGTDVTNGGSTFTVNVSGTYYIRAQNINTNIWSNGAGSLTVSVLPDVSTPIFTLGASSNLCQGSGSVIYDAISNNATGITYSLDAASITGGNAMDANTGEVTYASGWSGISTITASAAGCNGPMAATHTVTITPTVDVPVFALGASSTRCQGAGAVSYTATATNNTSIIYSLDAASVGGGNSIDVSTGDVTFDASWTGSSVITATATGCNGPSIATHTITITPTVDVPVFALGASSTRCQGAGAVTYTATATNNTSIIYSLDAASVGGGNSIDVSTGDVTFDASWTGSSVITATATGCNGPSISIHTIIITLTVDVPAFALGASSTRCQGAGAVTYTATATNNTSIIYSLDAASIGGGNSIDVSTGDVTFDASWTGSSVITATATGCNGPSIATHTVTITPTVGVPVFTLGASSTRCQGAGTVAYTATATNNTSIIYSLDAASIGGGNSIDVSTGDVTFDASWTGSSVITATATGCNGPSISIHTIIITLTVDVPAFALGASSTRCQGAGAVNYTATATNNTSIIYSLDAASIGGGNSIDVSTGDVTFDASWTGSSVITATATGCNGPSIATHTITITPTVDVPVFALGASSTRCQGAGAVNYGAIATTTTGITYTLNAASITGGNSINGSTGDVTYASTWSGTSIITASAAGCNGPRTATHTVTITPTVGTPVFTLGASSTRCQGAGTVTYTATSSNNTGITYTLDAASLSGNNTINASTGALTYDAAWTGTSIVTASASGCNGPSVAMHTITITLTVGTPVFTIGSTSTRCQGAGTVNYGASATNTTGITYSLNAASITGGNSINSVTGTVTYASGWSGTSTITASAAGCNGPMAATHTVTITPTVGVTVFTLGASSTRCQGAGAVTYTATATNNTSITYSLDAASVGGGNSIDVSTGDVTFDASWTGSSVITVTATGCNGPSIATHTITITPTVGLPVFASGATSTRCQGAGSVTYTATATNNTSRSYTLDAASLAGGNTINASTGAVSYSSSWSGTSQILITATGCNGPSTATHTVTITPTVGVPVFALGASSTRCQGAGAVNYGAIATTTTGITYTLNAASITGGNSINGSTGDVTYASTWSGTSIITASAAGCNGPRTATHTVTITPTVGTPVFTLGASSTRCQGAGTVTYTATSSNNTGITYTLDAASLSGNNIINASTGALTYDAAWTGTSIVTASASGCNGPSVAMHTITITLTVGTPVFTIGSTSTRCQGAGTVNYGASATNTTGITYSLNAASITGGNSINSVTGTVTYASGWSGTSTITASAAGCNGPMAATHTVTITPTVGVTVFTLGASSTRCQGAGAVTYTATATNNTGVTYTLDGASISGGNTIDPATGTVTYPASWSGTTVITASATGCNGPRATTHTVSVTPTVGTPVFSLGASSVRCQSSTNVTYTATATTNTGITYSLDAASIAGGNTIISSSGFLNYTSSWSGTSVVTATANGCNGPSVSTHTITLTPTVGTPVFGLGSSSVQCQGAGTVNYGATATTTTGITYTLNAASVSAGNTINASTGDVNYISSWSGTSIITANATGCNGPRTATHTVTITPTVGTPVFTLGTTTTRCQGASTVNYTSTATNNTGIAYTIDASSLAGGNTINAATGAVTYDAAWTGTSVVTATAGGCNGPSTATHTVTITPTVGNPVFASGTTSARCQGSGTITYTATSTNNTGITYSLDLLSTTFGNSISSSTGSVTFLSGWSGASIVTANATGCNGPVTSTHTVTVTPTVSTPIFTAGSTSSRCQGANIVNYGATAANSTSINYSLDAASLAAGNSINASTGDVSYVASWITASTITATAVGCNGPRTATHSVTNNPSVTTPVFAKGSTSTICQGSGNIFYTASATNTSGITYSLDAASTAAGNFIRTDGRITFINSWSGTTIVTASAAGCNGPKTITHTITITPFVGNPVFTLGTTSTRCQGAGTVTYTATATDANSMAYSLDNASTTSGNTINTSTGAVTYLASWTGSSTITATATGCNGITTATHTVIITPTVGTPIFSLGATSNRCQNGNTVTYTSTASNSTSISYSLDATTVANGSSINASTGVVSYAAGWVGTSTITATATGCNGPSTRTHTVTITPSVTTPFFLAGATSTRCQGAGTVTYTGTAANTTGLTYSLDAASLAGGCTILPSTGAVTFAASWSGTSVVTVSATGCNGPKTATHTVTITPNGRPTFTPATSTRCQGAGTVTYTGSSANNSGVTYSLDAASIIGGNTITAATGAVAYLATWSGTTTITSTATGCAGSVTSTHVVTVTPNGTATFALGPVSSRLQAAGAVTYSATSNNGNTVTYSLDPASLAGGNTINSSTGVVTFSASWTTTTVITASVNGCGGVATATHTVSINSNIVNKQLYFSDPSQSLDRIDPVSTNDITTATSSMVYGSTPVVTIDATSTTTAIAGPMSIAHTTGSGINRFMLVGISQRNRLVTSVTYGGQALSLVGENIANVNARISLYQLVNPPSGTASVVVNFSANPDRGAIVGVTTYTNVNQANPLGNFFTSQATSTNPTVAVTSATDELLYDVVAIRNNPLTVSAGQTQRWNIKSASEMYGASSTKTGSSSTNMAWTAISSDWAIGSVSIKPVSYINSTTFTQASTLCNRLSIAANKTITITAYLSNITGTIPAIPNVSALLQHNATTITTLTNPSYNSTTNLLTWTGTLPSGVAISAGESVAIIITNLQPNTAFSIDFDSKAKPSKIDLPVSTYINIDSLNVFNAPYPGGSVITSGVTGSSVYIRAVVSDPFGYNDINGTDFALSHSGGTVAATLVASSGCSRTYEYIWNTAAANGNYTIQATAKEGFENTVTAIQNTTFNFCTTCPPIAVSDNASGAGGAPLLLNVLGNDYDPNNNINTSSLSIITQPRNGSAILSGNKIVYLPNGSYTGKDTLTYQVCDLTSPTPLCAIGQAFVSIDPTIIDACSEAGQSHVYYVPYPEQDARTALLASQGAGLVITNLRTIISLKMPYPNMMITWDQWEDGYESSILNPQQNSTLVWGDGNPFNGIAPGYPNDLIPAGGSIVLDNTIPCNPRVSSNFFYDGRDKVSASGQITMTQVTGEPTVIGLQCMKTNITPTSDFGLSFTIPAGQNYNSQDFKYTALFIRAMSNNTTVNIDKDNNNVFDTTIFLNEGQSYLANGGILSGATIVSTEPVGVDLHIGGVDNYSSREVPIYPATWYSNVYYTPVPTTKSPDTAVVMLCNSLSRPLTINWYSGIPSSGSVTIPAKSVVRFPLALSATAAFKFVNLTGESFTAIEIADSYTPGGGGNSGSTFDWAFNLIAEERLTNYATVAWAPGSTDGTRNDNPIWVTPTSNTTVYVKYNGDVLSGGSIGPCGFHYDVAYAVNALSHKRILDPNDNDQSGIAIYTCDNSKLAAVYGEDPSTANNANPSWDVGTTIQPFCAEKIVLANDDYAYTMTSRPVTIDILSNDTAFLATLDPSSVTTTGFLQPKHGTISKNADGSILYRPNAGYIGVDSFVYSVCSKPAPISVVCDEALVIIYINSCPTPNNQNIISGQVFLDKNKNGLNDEDSLGFTDTKVYLYADGNCNGIATANELKDSVTVDNSGQYQFLVYPEKTVEDDFDGAGGVSSCASGSDGTSSWLTNWVDAGDAASVGFCVTPAQSYNNTNAEITKSGSYSYALRLKNPNVSATRTVNLSGATAAYLTFDYRRASATMGAGDNILVQASTNGASFTTIYTIAGDGTTDAGYVTVYNQNLLAYASATTYIRFVTSASMGNTDTVYIDNINITFLKYPLCYITKVATGSIPSNYYFTSVTQNAFSALAGGTCAFPFDFGVAKTSLTISGLVYNDANGLTDNLVNGILIGAPSATKLYAYLVDSTGIIANKSSVNITTGAYSFSNADVSTTYTVMLSTIDSALYKIAPASVALPNGWVSVGENYGTNNTAGTGNEAGLPNAAIMVRTGGSNVTLVNFGIEALPVAGAGYNSALNPGGTINVTIPASTFTNTTLSTDAAPGNITSIRITSYPPNVTSLTINGTIYTAANFPLSGVTIPATSTGQPTQTIRVDPYENFVRISFPYYVTDNAGKESTITGLGLFQVLNDNDRDGKDDQNDIDDDNDGITDFIETCGNGATTFSCLTGGSDPSADNDNDGNVNYKDPDFGTLNVAGCVASLDKDGDGIPDYLDLDSDNDGVPDVVEAYGVDADGDGLIDNYTDTDGDGLSQNVDANNTGAAGSGYGLGFKDFDGDGVPNTLDLDSDNDGIPDVIEAGCLDANNEGRADAYVDLNGNGWNDNYETLNALVKTSTDLNNDGRADSYPNKNADRAGYPNLYDLDSDDDGIGDATEAGYPYWITLSNGAVTGIAVNGWATAIQSLAMLNLANTDSRGPANYLDIDSDDDGISDNVEGQPTFSYVIPVDTDTDGDGLNNAYDASPNSIGGSGISPYDHDYDGLPDYIDLDTDNDGALDINEGSKILTINYGNIITTDADGDGLLDQYDNLSLLTLVAGSRSKNVSNSQMGAGGSFNGPTPSGSLVQLVRSNLAGDRDWRSISVLPLHVLTLSGELKQKISQLNFHVEGGQTTSYYTVERSTNGITFTNVGTIVSNQQANAIYNYSDDVRSIFSGKIYYRIGGVDVNGDKHYSNTVILKTDQSQDVVMKAYPNPVKDRFTLSVYSTVDQIVNVLIMDVNGKTVREKILTVQKGDNSYEFTNLNNLSKGVYMIKAIIRDVYIIRFIKE